MIFCGVVWLLKLSAYMKLNPEIPLASMDQTAHFEQIVINGIAIGIDIFSDYMYFFLFFMTGYWFVFFKL